MLSGDIIPVPLRRVRTTRSSTHSHPFQVSLTNPLILSHKSSFIPKTCNLWTQAVRMFKVNSKSKLNPGQNLKKTRNGSDYFYDKINENFPERRLNRFGREVTFHSHHPQPYPAEQSHSTFQDFAVTNSTQELPTRDHMSKALSFIDNRPSRLH